MKLRILCYMLLLTFVFPNKFVENNHKNILRSDRAKGYLHNGPAKSSVQNWGNLIDWDYNPSGGWENYTYVPTLGLMVGVPGKDENGNIYPWALRPNEENDSLVYWGPTVSESWFTRFTPSNNTDWEPVEGANGNSFYGISAGEVFSDSSWVSDGDSFPLLAHSNVEATWPTDDQLIPFWPGWLESNGDFFSDLDIYLEFDDRYAYRDESPTQGYPIGIRFEIVGSSNLTIEGDDATIFRAKLINESSYDYVDLYTGFYFDADVLMGDLEGYSGGLHTNADDMMGFNSDLDIAYIYDYDGSSGGATNIGYVGVMYINDSYSNVGLTGMRWFDWYVRPGVSSQEGNNNCCAGDPGKPGVDDMEAIQYALLSNNINYPNEMISDWEWRGIDSGENPRMDEYNEWYFHPNPENGYMDPNFDSIEAIYESSYFIEGEDGLDCITFMSSGPFNINSGDTLELNFALVFGEDESDLFLNAENIKSYFECSVDNLGDVNQDGIINIMDIITVANIVLDNTNPTECQITLADVNQNGIVNIADIILIINIILA